MNGLATHRFGRSRLGLLAAIAVSASCWTTPAATLAAGPTPGSGSGPAAFTAACPQAQPGHARCFALVENLAPGQASAAVSGSASPQLANGKYLEPADLQNAYGLTTAAATQGTGLTVAVVDAYHLANAEAAIAAYRSFYGLPACTTASGCFRQVDEHGGTNYPATNAGWNQEELLDLDMVSAICPHCNILLVEATTTSISDLGTAVNTAVALGADAVSNSYGAIEAELGSSGAEFAYDAYYNHPGVVITAATGDCGYLSQKAGCYADSAQYPSVSPYVIAVGGTSLHPASNARGWSETAWSGGGGGCSIWEPKPSFQTDTLCTHRMTADISAVSDPSTGVVIWDPSSNGGSGGFYAVGGTSAATPIIAAAYMLAGKPAAGANPLTKLYANGGSLTDITSGSTGVQAGSTYVPLTPNRLVDSRASARIGMSASLVSNSPASFQVTNRLPGDQLRNVPPSATAVTGNLTVVGQTAKGYLSLTPKAPVGVPDTSTLNFPVDDIRANGVTVALGPGGVLWVTFVGWAGNTTDVVFDVTGYYVPDGSGSTYIPLTPNRLVDSRASARIGLSATLVSGNPVSFQVTNRLPGDQLRNVPPSATAVTGNLTVVGQSAKGYLSLTPKAPVGVPDTSTLNFPADDIRANGVTVALGPGGVLWVTYIRLPGNTTDVVFDVTGYYVPDGSGSTYIPLTPNRLVDSRASARIGLSATLVSGSPAWFQVAERLSGDQLRNVPAAAGAVTGNLTVVGQSAKGYLSLTPKAPAGVPDTSTLNFPVDDIRANGVTVALGPGGVLWVTYIRLPGNTTDTVFDVTGYYTNVGGCAGTYLCTALAGYDGPTGLGTPYGLAALTPDRAPGAPTAVTALAGNTQALVSWTAPASSGTTPITGYTVTASHGGSSCTTTGATSCLVGSLTNGSSYTFTVTASNTIGVGPASSPSNSISPAAVPYPPTGVAAVRGAGSADVTWTAPVDGGGSPITLYTVTSSPGGFTCTNAVAGGCTVGSLTSGVSYTFTVTATNTQGQSLPSNPSAAVVPTVVTSQP
jgi:hypothetical protein